MRQFGWRQILLVIEDASHFVFDYNECDKIPFAKTIHKNWVGWINWKESMAKKGVNTMNFQLFLKKTIQVIIINCSTKFPSLNFLNKKTNSY